MSMRHRIAPEWTLSAGTLISALLLSILIGSQPVACNAATLVLDPGHGGREQGIGTSDGFSESQFTLGLARKIASRLSDRHHVALTRTTDIAMPPYDRTSVANQAQADLFISLHGGALPYCSEGRAVIYVHEDRSVSTTSSRAIDTDFNGSADDQIPWDKLQHPYIPVSRKLAERIAHRLLQHKPFNDVSVAGAPLAVLMGANRPAVLIEVGCIFTKVSPSPETIENQMNRYAQAIAEAIHEALAEAAH